LGEQACKAPALRKVRGSLTQQANAGRRRQGWPSCPSPALTPLPLC